MKKHAMTTTQYILLSRQLGMSLVELMIAMVLGLVLTLGVVQIFTSASQTYRLTDRVGQLQEDMRYMIGRLQSDGRMAGNTGCSISEPDNLLNPAGNGFNAVAFGGNAVVGWEAQNTGIGAVVDFGVAPVENNFLNGAGTAIPNNVDATTFYRDSDFFILNGVIRKNLNVTNTSGNNINLSETTSDIAQYRVLVVVTADCQGGDIFQKRNQTNSSGVSAGTGAGNNPGPGNVAQAINSVSQWNYGPGATIYELYSTLYFIRQGASGEPALFAQRIEYENAPAQELVSGVESMQVLYGVSPLSGVRRATQYVSAANVNNWANVVSVRIALLMRSANPVQDEAEMRAFNLLGTQITAEPDRRARLLGTTTIAIRNRLQ